MKSIDVYVMETLDVTLPLTTLTFQHQCILNDVVNVKDYWRDITNGR